MWRIVSLKSSWAVLYIRYIGITLLSPKTRGTVIHVFFKFLKLRENLKSELFYLMQMIPDAWKSCYMQAKLPISKNPNVFCQFYIEENCLLPQNFTYPELSMQRSQS